MVCCFTTSRSIGLIEGVFVLFCLFCFVFCFCLLGILGTVWSFGFIFIFIFIFTGREKLAGVFLLFDPSGRSKVLADTRLAGGCLVYFFF